MWLGCPAKDTPDLPPPNEPASGGGPFGSRPRLQVCPAAQSGSREKKPAQSLACWPTGRGAGGSWPRPRCQAPPPTPSGQPLGGGARGAQPGSACVSPAPGSGPSLEGSVAPRPVPPLRPAPEENPAAANLLFAGSPLTTREACGAELVALQSWVSGGTEARGAASSFGTWRRPKGLYSFVVTSQGMTK